MPLNEITRRLLGGNSDERNSFIGRLEPDNLWFLLLTVLLVTTSSLAMMPLRLLLFLRCLATGSEETKRTKAR